ncbi:MAG: fused MFS/spermidine synthase [Deltaproteobacteria bacterium]|nr:fused MFS/spermidine synthase [Deltaproteobacteria bacterium]
MNTARITRYLLIICFFITGVTGLVYELVWTRMLILAFGSTQFAVTTVLTSFMAGLAIGSLILGRLIDRYNKPIAAYGIVEIIIGAYCLLTPYIFSAMRTFYLTNLSAGDIHYASFNLTQFMLAFAGIIIPTTLMGGTFPILARYFTAAQQGLSAAAQAGKGIGFNVGMLYSVNTMGAVIGCAITGFFALYIIGVNETVFIAGIVDIAIGIMLVSFAYKKTAGGTQEARGERQEAGSKKEETIGSPANHSARFINILVLGAFAVSGFAALAYEVLWFRIFSLIIGSSIYAFTIMLATFLFGIGIGSIAFAPFIDKRKNPILWFALFEFIIGFSVLIAVPWYKDLPFIFLKMFEAFSGRFWVFLFMQSLLCSAIMIIPTISMGAIFPAVSRIYAREPGSVGKGIGNIYFLNTLGAIAGSFIGGFVFVPFIGIQKSIILLTGINILLALILLAVTPVKARTKTLLALVVITCFLILAPNIPQWDRMIMTIGPYANPIDSQVVETLKHKGKYGELLFYKEGLNAIITVRKEADGRTISYQSNGKYEAKAVDLEPGKAWSLLGHIPMLLSKKSDSALVIGLGSGITLGAMEQYPLKDIDVVELEPAVVEAATYFSAANNNALDDSRIRLHITDGRNFLFTTKKRYDVIVSAVSDPWITGVSNLFTKEYFNEINSKLTDDGVSALWFQNYRISTHDLKTGLNTFASAFPYVSLWFHYSGTSDLIVIGSKQPHNFELEYMAGRVAAEKVQKDLARIDILNPFDILNLFLMGNNDMRNYIKQAAINTDNRPILEFTLPMLLYSNADNDANERVLDMLSNAHDFVPPVIIPEIGAEDFYYRLGVTYASYVFRADQAIQLFEKALAINPRHKQARQYLDALRSEQKKAVAEKGAF